MKPENRFNVFDVDGTVFLEDHIEGSYHIGEMEDVDIPCLKDIAYLLNKFHEENQELKKQLEDCTAKAKEEIRKEKEEMAIRWANIGR